MSPKDIIPYPKIAGIPEEQPPFRDAVIQVLKEIPFGKVTTYGTVAVLAGFPRGARWVGGFLHFNSEKYKLPWHRVINRHGFISTRCEDHTKEEQKALLENEGIEVSDDYVIDLKRYGWPSSAKASDGK